ncbi:hypothetical protein JCM8097_001030 [Rhodosporidiobolus ruineniae]
MARECAVCTKPGTLCSACQQACYCSRTHQRLLWKTHKVNCPSTHEFLVVPPLSSGDVDKVNQLRILELAGVPSWARRTDRILLELKAKKLFDGGWENLLTLLHSGTPSLAEPARTHLHIILLNLLPERDPSFPTHTLTAFPWALFSRVAASFVRPPLDGDPLPFPNLPESTQPLVAARPFLEPFLNAVTLIFANPGALDDKGAVAGAKLNLAPADRELKKLGVSEMVRKKWESNHSNLLTALTLVGAA